MAEDPKACDHSIDLIIHDESWSGIFEDPHAFAARAVAAARTALDVKPKGEVSIAYVDNAQIQMLNRDYRGKDKPTNVLSFAGDNLNPCLGEIVIAYGVVKAEAEDKALSMADHTAHLLVHGYLHLSGYDHESDVEAAQMEALEIKILESLGLKNPYESYENV